MCTHVSLSPHAFPCPLEPSLEASPLFGPWPPPRAGALLRAAVQALELKPGPREDEQTQAAVQGLSESKRWGIRGFQLRVS